MIETAVILPTGNEILEGVVLDTDSPEILRQLIHLNPDMQVRRCTPVRDEESSIREAVRGAAAEADLVVLIGGSGGGHRFSASLGKDFTHTALEEVLEEHVSRQLFGKNGHLWCKLVCGFLGGARVINLPGPFVEARAAMEAFCRTADDAPETINGAMAQAVLEQYPIGAKLK